jgi:nitroimidazol reductase NimA-like FMN-containing flavoprotein (pyridoxamine 5'-phosphate oxidase superfamily)
MTGTSDAEVVCVRLRKAVTALLTLERVCRVGTVDEHGLPHLVTVCHVVADGRIYFATGSGTRKTRNLRANPRATVLVDVYSEDWSLLRGVMVQGAAKLIDRGPLFRRVRKLLYEKYPQYPVVAAIEEADDLMVEVTPTHVSSWGIES